MEKQLLIIEEEKDTVSGLEAFLTPKGYVLFIADNLQHGVEMLRSLHIDGVLLSLDMLEGKDPSVLTDLRSQFPRIPVVVMSSSPSRQLVLESFAGGVRGHISKPIVQEQLQEALFIFEGHLT